VAWIETFQPVDNNIHAPPCSTALKDSGKNPETIVYATGHEKPQGVEPYKITGVVADNVAAITVLLQVFHRPSCPCSEPLTYRIGSVDARFRLDDEEVRHAVHEAVSLWDRASGRELFREDPQGDIVINLVYDYRQELRTS
jgi:hypothetical protein